MTLTEYGAVLFDLDGVLTPTADVHMRAWSELFNTYLSGVAGQEPYTDDDYYRYVDGKPRYDGVRDFLAARGIVLPDGDPADAPGEGTVCALGNRKNAVFNEVIARDGIEPYPGSLRLVEQLAAAAVPMAVVSSSKNAPAVLEAAGIADYFPVVVDGNVAVAEGLPGKPAPDTFLRAAALFGVEPSDAVVVEDAVSGIAAGAAGGFALVIGVDRGVGAEELRAHGATVVVTDLEELRQS
ncbi:MAG TPA: beta-phosphoglucomutase family hydrolase [Arachnia sp.]|nr:beta-phosphoglucomutase family hydrolase [Arachnia sp.]HMT87599.1 beta-phosphoglucomutase family hydrolase [Arachnia sp.]